MVTNLPILWIGYGWPINWPPGTHPAGWLDWPGGWPAAARSTRQSYVSHACIVCIVYIIYIYIHNI